MNRSKHPRLSVLICVSSIVLACKVGFSAKKTTEQPWARHTIDDTSQGADGVRLADVNGDGLLDITTGWEEGGRIRVYLNPGPEKVRQPWPAVTAGEVAKPEDAVFVDLDGDGAIDVVSSCEGETRTMFVHWAPQESGRYLDAPAWNTEILPESKNLMRWMFSLPMQMDGRRGIDLVAGAKDEGAAIGWFQAPDNARDLAAWKWHPLYKAGWVMSLMPYDMDGDGDIDIVATDRYGPKRGSLWLENPGPEQATATKWREHRIGPADEYQAMFLTIEDVNQDWLDDVIVAVRGGPIRYHQRTNWAPPAWRTHTIELPPHTGTGKGVAVGDIDLDGRRDLVFSCEQATGDKAGVMWMSYRESATDSVWDAHPISGPEGIKFDLVRLLDLDDDGDLDVITCEEKANLGVIWYENPAR